MKHIFVEENLFGYVAIDESHADELVAKGYFSVDIISDMVTITLVFHTWLPLFSMNSPEEIANEHIDKYFQYISSITGLDVPVVE